MVGAGLITQGGRCHRPGECTGAPISVENRKHLAAVQRCALNRFHPEPCHAALHGQKTVGIHQASHLLSEGGPVFDLLGGTAMVPGTSLHRTFHQIGLQTHRVGGFRHSCSTWTPTRSV
jgi:hypothetical protein